MTLQRVENVSISFQPGFFKSKGRYVVATGRQSVTSQKIDRAVFSQMLTNSATYPVRFARFGERVYWCFNGRWFWENENLSDDQVHALLHTRDQRRLASINRAQSTVAMGNEPRTQALRGAISDEVKHFVWTRDQGRCRRCGSNVELQYDHVIPFSMGGSSEPENLQILCGPCNRLKGAAIAAPAMATRSSAPTAPSAPTSSTVPAGWYPDPRESQRRRYWDGWQWTSSTAATTTSS
jgi:hypothetical protein